MSFDYNADNYNRNELLSILELPPFASLDNILGAINPYILKYTSEKNGPFLSFFVRAREILINSTTSGVTMANSISVDLTHQTLQDTEDKVHTDTSERVQNESGNAFGIPIKQDVLNPNLKNVVTRLIHLDSQFRQSTVAGSSTDYTLDLSDPLKNVLSLRLYSIQIPFSWYIIDTQYNNNVFWVTTATPHTIQIIMPSGNYTPTTFVASLNATIRAAITDISGTPVSYSESTGKLTLTMSTTTTSIESILFFDFNEVYLTAPHVNSTLGWLMGFRSAVVQVDLSGNVADGVLDLYGTKNLLFVLDDYNQNHVNNGLVSITETSKTLHLPSYYRPDLPFSVMPPANTFNNDITDYGGSAMRTFRSVPIMKPSAPRLLTQSQIYTVNEIMKSREQTMTYRTRAPTSPDIFAMIPVKHGGMKIGDVYVEFGSSLQTNMRVYFGPVNIERMRIRLMDDKGNIVNLNGMDWSVTLISENLYQY